MPHAFVLHLSPAEKLPRHRYLHQYSHGLFYQLLQQIDPAVSEHIHAQAQNPFTLWAKERHDSTIILRISLLDESLFQPLLKIIVGESLTGLMLGQDNYRISKVIATPEGDRDAGYDDWHSILRAEAGDSFHFHWLSPTVFSSSRGKKRLYTPLPLPRLIFQSLLRSFQRYSPMPYSASQQAEFHADFEDIVVQNHTIRSQGHIAGKTRLTGFVGKTNVRAIQCSPAMHTLLGRLAALSFYSGVGAKTPYGMGQVRLMRKDEDALEETKEKKEKKPRRRVGKKVEQGKDGIFTN